MHIESAGTQPSTITPDEVPPVPRATWDALFSCCAILALCLVVGVPTIRADNYFLGDDFGLVHHLHDMPFDRFLTYFYSDWTEGIYGYEYDELRPFLALTYRIDSGLFGATNAQGYHATNVILHVLNGLLVLAIARSLVPRPSGRGFGLLAASLFVLMPSNVEPIAWISGRVDSLAALFYLGAFLCFVQFRVRQRRTWLLAALLAFVCGLFVKQSLVTFPLLILAYDLVYAPSIRGLAPRDWISRYAWHIPFFLLLLAYLGLRHKLFGNAVREELFTLTLAKEFIFRQLFYFKRLLPIATDVSFPTKAGLAILTIVSLAACGRRMALRPADHGPAIRRVIFFGAIWYVITVAPMIVAYESARHLYVTGAGLSIALASLIFPVRLDGQNWAKAARLVVAGALLVLYGVALNRNVRIWVENGTESQKFAVALPNLLQSVQRGSVVLIGIPDKNRECWFWSWGMPFALQTPFQPEDLYAQFEIVERPEVYCCTPQQWWASKQMAITSVLNSPAPQELTAILPAPQDPASLHLVTRSVSGPALRLKIERAMGRTFESLSAQMNDAETRQLARILLD
jgi:hypothetical protein